ncbi:3-phosphoserine/phosphohydroxythreonine transaminase [Pradoshia sp.]
MARAYNFNAGPAALPEEVLLKAQKEFLDFEGSHMSVMELSHRSKEYSQVHDKANALLRELMEIPENYEILLLQGGASLQFSMVPMNLLDRNLGASYILTGSWSEKAVKEAKRIGPVEIAASTKASGYHAIPPLANIHWNKETSYVHLTSNNTIYGTQWQEYPQTGHIPLIADMSSDIMSKKIDVSRFGLIYAGAQKNLGPSGVTVVIIRKDLIKKDESLPTMLSYHTHASSGSLYNTPPTLAIYLLSLVLEWTKDKGGVSQIEKLNQQKAKLIYDAIDESNGFYTGHADRDSRSNMNITFTLPSSELTDKFLQEAADEGFIGLSGHRSVGGCRASIYNAVPHEHCLALAEFMKKFKNTNS